MASFQFQLGVPRMTPALQQLIALMESPPSPEQHERVLEIVRENPGIMGSYILHRQKVRFCADGIKDLILSYTAWDERQFHRFPQFQCVHIASDSGPKPAHQAAQPSQEAQQPPQQELVTPFARSIGGDASKSSADRGGSRKFWNSSSAIDDKRSRKSLGTPFKTTHGADKSRTNLQHLIAVALKTPSSSQEQQRVLAVLKAHPFLMAAFLRRHGSVSFSFMYNST